MEAGTDTPLDAALLVVPSPLLEGWALCLGHLLGQELRWASGASKHRIVLMVGACGHYQGALGSALPGGLAHASPKALSGCTRGTEGSSG